MQLPEFRKALEQALSTQIIDNVLMKAYVFQETKNNARKERAQYGTVKLERNADAMWENIVANLLVSMQGKKDEAILKQLEDSDFIDTITDMLEEVEFNNES
ncbi:hypothetical protein [Leuconostoc gasicomitatum]|uniref:hypothetical protein n=1 Tax=Leuconostoc gasicomitatum TaxID=115778 RepID=UPI000744A976|nr:hypothetical protein [Leuconostoc gasicomitatum]MBR2276749.1 hypothetical protein [Leuconostoc sp.]MBZ5953784.1 hypothetical protein [Leuconostoc gasicomitatum]MBZ5955255.1 hypothetical protein [Leuconostoc gasicomitatum]MBZ5987533.1 hypothetical protein [Leuconostoc gasicomitatum]MBZ5991083.1 hypothetical protein [Leuconostoc gasicomitatum]